MSRLQDSVIDDDEECCPLCIEEFDLSDKNFRPCPCGYQICQFCYNSLKITYEKSNCPNCRRLYDEKTIQYKIPTAEEFKLDQQAKNRKQAAAKRKETEKKEVENSSRRNLAGVRVKQQNLVYVIGLVPDLKDEPKLLQTLRGKEYFGQYGEIEKIVVSKAKPGQTNQGVGVYVTFARKEDAAVCIAAIDGTKNEDRLLRAQYGTTKYCSAYLRGEECNNKSCSFLHETGEDGQESNLQNEQIAGKVVSKPIGTISTPTRPPPVTQASAISQPMARQTSSDTADSRKGSNVDPSALPSSASWAQANPAAPATKSRRTSQATRPSPQIAMAIPSVKQQEDTKPKEVRPIKVLLSSSSQVSAHTNSSATTIKPTIGKVVSKPAPPKSPLDGLMAALCSGNLSFSFNEAAFTPEEMAAVKRHPNLIDPFGGAKMRLQKDKEAAERAKIEAELAEKLAAREQVQSEQLPIDTNADEDNVPAGSLALGGEPEEDLRSTSARGTIQRPTQPNSSTNFINDQFANMNGTGRSLTPQQRQQLALLSGVQKAPGLGQPSQPMLGSETFDFERRGAQFSSQSHYESMPGHQRQGSRYFNNENTKSSRNQAASFYTSGVQGPPPGLKTAGTPPFSGGATFAHGQGFTSSVNAGFGAKDSNADYARGRSGTGAGHDMSKRGVVDHADPNILQSRMHLNSAGAGQGLFGGQNQGGYQQSNSMYGGGGYGRGCIDRGMDMMSVVFRDQKAFYDDYSGRQAFHGIFGLGDTAYDENFPALPSRRPAAPPGLSRVASVQNSIDLETRSSTPKLPPGLNISHAHPSPPETMDTPIEQETVKGAAATPGPVVPAVPLLPIGQRTEIPKPKASEADEKKQPSDLEMATEISTGGKAEASIVAADISLGSPKPRRGQSKIEGKPETVHETELVSDPIDGLERNSEPKRDIETRAIKNYGPGKIIIPPARTESKSDITRSDTAKVDPAEVVETPSMIDSQPSTPATPVRATARPLVVRLVTGTTKPADTTPASATTERSSGMPHPSLDRHLSRRPSISSISHTRSSTPAMSDAFSFGASRASSPPPGIVGSAPERTKTKAQQRKDRKDKAKQSVESEQASGTTTPAVVEEVAPVISRQRKQKKRVEISAYSGFPLQASEETDKVAIANNKKESSYSSTKLRGSDADTKAPAKPKRQDSVKSSAPPTPREESKPSPLIHEPPLPKWTLRDLYSYTAKHPDADIQTLLNANVSSTVEILTSLMTNNDLDMTNPLFNPPPLSLYRLPADSRRGADYLDANGYTDSNPFGMLYLTQDKKRAIQNGHAVRISDASKPNDLLRRAMVSPTGTVWRHLNEAEEERVLELEERREVYAEEYGAMGLGMMDKLTVLEEDDYMNLEGGMDRLARNGEAHGVSWVMHDDEEEDEEGVDGENDDDELDEEYDDEEEDEDLTDDDEDLGLNVPGGWETGLALGTVPENVHITNKANVLPPMRLAPGGENENTKRNGSLRGMDVAGLVERIREAQREVETARREVEKCEKSVGRKNKEVGRWREASLKATPV